MKQYEKYKPSAIAWLGEIPEHWGINRAKTMFLKVSRPVEPNDDTVTCFRDGVVTLRKNRRTSGFTESLKEIGYQGIRKGDLVIHVMEAFARAKGVSETEGKGTPDNKECVTQGDYNNYYYAHIVREMAKTNFIQSLYRGIRERSSDFRFDVFGKQSLPIPPLSEQEQIVRFLDSRVGQINRFVRGKKREIELLKELKQAEINQAVTKGINPNAPLKDSGIEWLGEIPEHWEVRRLKSLVRLVNEKDSSANKPDIGLENIQSWTGNYILSEESIAEGISNVFLQGDILFGKLRPYLAKCIIAPFDGVCSSELLVLRGFIGDSRFLNLSLLSSKLIYHINSSTYGAKMPRANWTFIGNSLFPYPPIAEQQQIVAHLNERMAKIDNIIASTENEIKLVQEYKTRLISDAVTGKIDVRDIEIPDADSFEDLTEQDIEITEDSTEITQ